MNYINELKKIKIKYSNDPAGYSAYAEVAQLFLCYVKDLNDYLDSLKSRQQISAKPLTN